MTSSAGATLAGGQDLLPPTSESLSQATAQAEDGVEESEEDVNKRRRKCERARKYLSFWLKNRENV